MNPKTKVSAKKKPEITHYCSQKEQIGKLNLLLLGNGNPKDGYVFKVMEMTEQVNNIHEKLTGIGGIVKELHEESINKKAIKKTDAENKAENRAVWLKWVQTFAFIVGACGLLLTAYFGFRNGQQSTKIDNKIETMGVPIVTRNGKFFALPDSTQIRFFPNDSVRYVIKKETK
jgi:hypothetical protein